MRGVILLAIALALVTTPVAMATDSTDNTDDGSSTTTTTTDVIGPDPPGSGCKPTCEDVE